MSLLTIAKAAAKNVGLAVPDQVIGGNDRSWSEFTAMADAAGEELARRVDWGQLTQTTTLTGDGTQLAHSLPDGFSRIAQGVGVKTASGIVRPLTRAEWNTLDAVEGTPRYFLLENDTIKLWPHLASAATATVSYQTENWCSNGTGKWVSDDDTSLIDEELFLKCVIVRWRRQKGMDYADYEAEYEAALGDFGQFNDRARL